MKHKIFFLFACITIILMPIKIEYTNYSVIILALIWFKAGHYKKLIKVLNKHKISFIITILFCLPLLSVIFYHDTENIKQLEKKLAFLIFPIIFSTTEFLNKKRILLLIQLFGYAVTGICVFALIKILIVYINNGWLPNLGEGPWVKEYILMHRPYFGMYSVFTIINFLYFIEKKVINKYLGIFIIISNTLVIFFITSKLAIIFLGMYLIFKAFNFILKKKLIYKGLLMVMLFFVPLLFMYFFNTEFFLDRINSPIENQNRIKTWSSTIEVFRGDSFNMFFGFFSVSEFQSHLNDKLLVKNYDILNTHNQYLEYIGSYGLIGLLVFTFTLSKLFLYALEHKEILFINFLLLICLQSFVENIFYRQWGIFFIAIFISLFIRLIIEKYN